MQYRKQITCAMKRVALDFPFASIYNTNLEQTVVVCSYLLKSRCSTSKSYTFNSTPSTYLKTKPNAASYSVRLIYKSNINKKSEYALVKL